jgi:hypothetical protein
VRGCLFHYSQAVLRNIKRLHLFIPYRDDSKTVKKDGKVFEKDGPFRKVLRMTMALPLLPKHEARLVWKHYLKPKLLAYNDERTKNFADYFENQWMSLAPQLWNFYRMDRRGTNPAEAYHSTLQR